MRVTGTPTRVHLEGSEPHPLWGDRVFFFSKWALETIAAGLLHTGFPGDSDSKASVCPQYGRPGFDPQVGKIPWRRKWQPTPVLLPRKFHGWRSLVGYSPWGRKESTPLSNFSLSLVVTYACSQGASQSLWRYDSGICMFNSIHHHPPHPKWLWCLIKSENWSSPTSQFTDGKTEAYGYKAIWP